MFLCTFLSIYIYIYIHVCAHLCSTYIKFKSWKTRNCDLILYIIIYYLLWIYILKLFFFQIFKDVKKYINVKQLLMFQRKIITRNLEIKKHIEHIDFQDIIVQS